MKQKLPKWLFVGINVLTVILLFSVGDHSLHVLKDAWSVPDFYFVDKVPFGFLWGLAGLWLARKAKTAWMKAFLFSALIAIVLQTRYLLTGYAIDFVFIFMGFHFVILFVVSWGMFAAFKKYITAPVPAVSLTPGPDGMPAPVQTPTSSIGAKQIVISLIIMLVVAVGTYYAVFDKSVSGGHDAYTSYTYTPENLNNPVIEIKDFNFSPKTISIKVGTTVTWINKDTAPHTVTSVTGKLLDSPSLATGESFTYTFTEVGTADYYCNFHPMMKGQVVVTE